MPLKCNFKSVKLRVIALGVDSPHCFARQLDFCGVKHDEMHLVVVYYFLDLQFNCLNENKQLSLRRRCSFFYLRVCPTLILTSIPVCPATKLHFSRFFSIPFSFAAGVARQQPPPFPDPEFINPASVPNPVPVRRKAAHNGSGEVCWRLIKTLLPLPRCWTRQHAPVAPAAMVASLWGPSYAPSVSSSGHRDPFSHLSGAPLLASVAPSRYTPDGKRCQKVKCGGFLCDANVHPSLQGGLVLKPKLTWGYVCLCVLFC